MFLRLFFIFIISWCCIKIILLHFKNWLLLIITGIIVIFKYIDIWLQTYDLNIMVSSIFINSNNSFYLFSARRAFRRLTGVSTTRQRFLVAVEAYRVVATWHISQFTLIVQAYSTFSAGILSFGVRAGSLAHFLVLW